MTRQIALAIFAVAMLTMITAGLLTYAIARQTLLAELDQTLHDRAVTRLSNDTGKAAPLPAGDRFLVENQIGQTLARSPLADDRPASRIVARQFSKAATGARMRTIVIEVPAEGVPTRMIYSSPAAAFDRLQNRLASVIAITVTAGGVLTLATAVVVSRRVTRPLQQTAQVIGTVDDANLHRRIDASQVPIELVPMVERLNQMLARLEEAFRRQGQFLADAAHELRTPVAALRTSLEIALSRPRPADQLAATMQRAIGETVQLAHIVESLLDCIRSGPERSMDLQSFDVATLVRECVEQIRPLAEKKAQSIDIRMTAAIVHSEPHTLRTAVRNLLTNATSYTPSGGVIQVFVSSEGETAAAIEIADNGPGIPPEQRERIFEAFYRGDEARSPQDHLGLGLYLVRRAMNRLGGQVELSSEVGRGTRFRVIVPRGTPPETVKLSVPSLTHGPMKTSEQTVPC